MPTYDTPGSTTSAPTRRAPAIAPLRTDIAGFVGIAERGPLDIAVPVESWRQFAGVLRRLHRRRLPGLRRARVLRERRPALLGRARRLAEPRRATGVRSARRCRRSRGRRAGASHAVQPGRVGQRPRRAAVARRTARRRSTHAAAQRRRLRRRSARSPASRAARWCASQPGAARRRTAWSSAVDAERERLVLGAPDAGAAPALRRAAHRLRSRTQPLLIESVEYTLLVRELGRPCWRATRACRWCPSTRATGRAVLRATSRVDRERPPRLRRSPARAASRSCIDELRDAAASAIVAARRRPRVELRERAADAAAPTAWRR